MSGMRPANTLGRVIASAEKATTPTAQVFAAGAAIKSRSRSRQPVGFSSIGMERRQKDPVAEGDLGLCLIGAWLTRGISSQVLYREMGRNGDQKREDSAARHSCPHGRRPGEIHPSRH